MARSFAPPLISQPTKNTAIGVFDSNDSDDIFQIFNKQNGIQVHMSADGSIDPPIFPQITYVLLDTNDLLNLYRTPVQLLPAPPAGFFLAPQYFSFQMVIKPGHPFTIANAGAGNTYVSWNSSPLEDIVFFPDSTAQTGMDYVNPVSQYFVAPTFSVSSVSLTGLTGKSIVMTMDDQLSNGAGAQMLVVIYYNTLFTQL